MLHVYARGLFSPDVTFTPAIGLGITTNLNYSLLAGGSFIFGRNQRATLSLGWSYNSVKQLSSANKEGDYVPSDYTLKTTTHFTNGFFISVGYNIGISSKSGTTQTADPSSDTATKSGKFRR